MMPIGQSQITSIDIAVCTFRRPELRERDSCSFGGHRFHVAVLEQRTNHLLDEERIALRVAIHESHKFLGSLAAECAGEPRRDGFVSEWAYREQHRVVDTAESLA